MMQQVIDEGFIFDVFKNYILYKVVYCFGLEMVRVVYECVDEKFGKCILVKWMLLYLINVGQKVQLIVEYFCINVVCLLNGQVKVMVVMGLCVFVVGYVCVFKIYCEVNGYVDLYVMVVFSGDVLNKDYQIGILIDEKLDIDYQFNEMNMNFGLWGWDMCKVFDMLEFQVMIVVNKFQIGFDQFKLVVMYVDKKILGVEVV